MIGMANIPNKDFKTAIMFNDLQEKIRMSEEMKNISRGNRLSKKKQMKILKLKNTKYEKEKYSLDGLKRRLGPVGKQISEP